MILVPRDASSEQVLDITCKWIEILVGEDYQAALDAISLRGLHGNWTPEFLRDDIKNYRSPEYYPGVEEFRVTSWRTAQGGNPEAQQEVKWFKPNSTHLVGAVSFDLPLNGQWSSLTADFVMWENEDLEEGYILGLEEISSWEQRWLEGKSAGSEQPAV